MRPGVPIVALTTTWLVSGRRRHCKQLHPFTHHARGIVIDITVIPHAVILRNSSMVHAASFEASAACKWLHKMKQRKPASISLRFT